MIHNLTVGHLNTDGIVTSQLDMSIVRALLDEFGETNAEGVPTLGGWKVRFENGCVVIPWKGGRTNHVAEEFALQLQRKTGCTVADLEHGRVLDVEALVRQAAADTTLQIPCSTG